MTATESALFDSYRVGEGTMKVSRRMNKLTKRDFLKAAPFLGAAAAAPTVSAQGEGATSEDASVDDLVDDRFETESGRSFGSQVIHHGEQEGFQVTPISQDKCVPGYQRPGNLRNPTVSALLRKRNGNGGSGSCDWWALWHEYHFANLHGAFNTR